MATHKLSLPSIAALSFAFLAACSASREYANHQAWFGHEMLDAASTSTPTQTSTGYGGQKVWCVGKPAAEDLYLRRNLDYACGEGAVDCTHIQPGGACYLPNTAIAHASYAMNMFYQKNGRNWWTCDFNNTGLVVFTDPSFGNCEYIAQW